MEHSYTQNTITSEGGTILTPYLMLEIPSFNITLLG